MNKYWEKYYGVINLSDRELKSDELEILGKGLKYCPTPGMVDHGLLKESIDKFFRICSLRLFFSNVEIPPPVEHGPFSHKDLKLPSKFNPPMPTNLYHIYYLVMDELLCFTALKKKHRVMNITPSQQTALRNLSDVEDIIIKKADKGSNIVIQNRNDYISECLSQLQNIKYYMKVDEDLSPKFKTKVDELVLKMHESHEIDDKMYLYLLDGGK